MSDKKQLVVLYVILMAVVIGGTVWMSHEINRRVALEKPVSQSTVQRSTLKVGKNYGAQVTAPQSSFEPKVSAEYYQYAPVGTADSTLRF